MNRRGRARNTAARICSALKDEEERAVRLTYSLRNFRARERRVPALHPR